MRYTRLVIEAEANTVSLALHPRLTVVAGVDPAVRAELAQELVGALAGDRSGVHLELAEDGGRRIAVFRPTGSDHRVVDVAAGLDISDDFRDGPGRIDLLTHYGVAPDRAGELLHVDGEALGRDRQDDEVVNRLAELDQRALWSAAARVRITEDELQSLSTGLEVDEDDHQIVSTIEKRHQTLEQAIEQLMRLRRHTAMVAGVSLAAALPIWYLRPERALPVMAVGLITVLLTFVYQARVEAAQRAERSALAAAGAGSYFSYVLQRVDGLFEGTQQRRRLLALADDHRSAAVKWTHLAGDVSVEWAMAHHDEIQATAELLQQLRTLGRVSPTLPTIGDDAAALARALVTHLARLRRGGRDGECLPLIIDDPFESLDEDTTAELLELLTRVAGPPQVVLLTGTGTVTAWARRQGEGADLALIEPHADPASATLAV